MTDQIIHTNHCILINTSELSLISQRIQSIKGIKNSTICKINWDALQLKNNLNRLIKIFKCEDQFNYDDKDDLYIIFFEVVNDDVKTLIDHNNVFNTSRGLVELIDIIKSKFSKNGINFDQYDYTFNGSLFPGMSEFDYLSINDIIHDIIINLNHKFNTLPRNAKSNIFYFLFGKCNIDWIQYDFIDADNFINNNVKTINNIDHSNEEFDFNSDETDTDEDNYSEYSDED